MVKVHKIAQAFNRWLGASPNPKPPSPDAFYPIPQLEEQFCFLKNFITRSNISVGEYTYYHDYHHSLDFENRNVLYHDEKLNDKLIIGKFCQIGSGVTFLMRAALHQTSGFSSYPFAIFGREWQGYKVDRPDKGDTRVGNDVWFGYNATILPGVKIGDGAIIAARAVVVKDVPPYTIVGGNPAGEIRKRFQEDIINTLAEIRWWDWPIDKITRNLMAITGADIEKLKTCI